MFQNELIQASVKNTAVLLFLFLSVQCGLYLAMAPLIPLCFLFKETVRFVMDYVTKSYIKLVNTCFEHWIGTKYFVYGEDTNPKENCLVVSNHRGCLDWLYFADVAEKYYRLSRVKIVLKHELKSVPGAGWGLQNNIYVFLRRKWEEDGTYIDKFIKFILKAKFRLQLLLFCEGTYYCEESLQSSNDYAEKNNLSPLKHLLHPRTTGFTYIFNKLRKDTNDNGCFEAVHDITIAYKGLGCFYETEVLMGKFPKEAHILIRRYPAESLPHDSDQLNEWLRKLWYEKDELLDYFYTHGHYPGKPPVRTPKRKYKSRFFIVLLYVGLVAFSLTALYTSSLFRWYVLFATIIFITVTHFYDGFDSIFAMF